MTLACHAETSYKSLEHSMTINTLQNNLGNYRHIQFTDKNIELNAVILNEGYQAKIYQQNSIYQFFSQSIRAVAQENNASVAINGGFYTPNFEPAGLFIENGKILKKVSRDPLLTTCIQLNKKGVIILEKKTNNCLQATYAMQTGPLLIEEGNISPKITVLPNNLKKLKEYFGPHRRTILAESSNKKLLIIITSPITLSEAADILKNSPHIFGVNKITTALNLDGGASTGMYVKTKDSYLYFGEIKPVKTFVLVK